MPQPDRKREATNKRGRKTDLRIEMLQIGQSRRGGGRSVSHGAADLTAMLGPYVARGENARQIGGHFRIGDHKAPAVLIQRSRQPGVHGLSVDERSNTAGESGIHGGGMLP